MIFPGGAAASIPTCAKITSSVVAWSSSVAILLTNTAALLCAVFLDWLAYPDPRCTFRPAFTALELLPAADVSSLLCGIRGRSGRRCGLLRRLRRERVGLETGRRRCRGRLGRSGFFHTHQLPAFVGYAKAVVAFPDRITGLAKILAIWRDSTREADFVLSLFR